MQRPWVKPAQVRDYSASEKVGGRTDGQLAFDIARAERYVVFYTHNRFDAPEYANSLPSDVTMAVIMLAEAYAKQSVIQKDGAVVSETFDDYSYTVDTGTDMAAGLGIGAMLDDYVIEDRGRTVMRLRKI